MAFNKHVRGCKKAPEDCSQCRDIIAAYRRLPLKTLSTELSDVVAPPMRVSIAALAVDALIDRTNHESKRGKADSIVAMSVLKQYEQRGGHL